MFAWICPQCGKEIPPSYSDCPNCAAKQPAAAPPAQPESAPSPGPPAVSRPPAARASATGVPGWLLSVLFALAFVAILAGGYFAYQKLQARAEGQPPPGVTFEAPSLPSPASLKAHPMAQHLELAGLRLTEDSKQKAYIQFVVINHSGADISDLAAMVNLKAITARREEVAVGTFSFKVPLLGPYESKDARATVDTKLRVYELPDWQFLRADFQITSP